MGVFVVEGLAGLGDLGGEEDGFTGEFGEVDAVGGFALVFVRGGRVDLGSSEMMLHRVRREGIYMTVTCFQGFIAEIGGIFLGPEWVSMSS